MPAAPRWILLRYSGEVSIKFPKTKQRFTKRLAQNVKNALGTTGAPYETEREWHRMIVETESPLALDILPHVFGLQSVSPIARRTWRDLPDLVNQGEKFFAEAVRGKRFAVRARRAGKTQLIPFRSADVQRALGTALLEHAARVDLRTPEVTAYPRGLPGGGVPLHRDDPGRRRAPGRRAGARALPGLGRLRFRGGLVDAPAARRVARLSLLQSRRAGAPSRRACA